MTSWSPKEGRRFVDLLDPVDVEKYLAFCVEENRIDFTTRDCLALLYAKRTSEAMAKIGQELENMRKAVVGQVVNRR